jgi:hypothetical protein
MGRTIIIISRAIENGGHDNLSIIAAQVSIASRHS